MMNQEGCARKQSGYYRLGEIEEKHKNLKLE
jgi:hypothetical protein